MMICLKKCFLLILVLCYCSSPAQAPENPLLKKGWASLVKDDDNEAFRYFFEAYQKANADGNTADKAESLLYLGICSFGSSLEKGLRYATQAMAEFKKLEKSNPHQAKIGRSKCLQLISTIYSRQKKSSLAMQMSKEVVTVLQSEEDASGTLGLAYSSLGTLYEQQKKEDSAAIYYTAAAREFKKYHNNAYLPNAYIKIGQGFLRKKQYPQSLSYFNKALALADSAKNKQAQISSLLALGNWKESTGKIEEAEQLYKKARATAMPLSDKLFEIKAMEALIATGRIRKQFYEVAELQKELLAAKEKFYSLEREQIAKNLEIQFEVSEKDRRLELISKEKKVSQLTSYLLGICIVALILIVVIGYIFLNSINKRDKQLLKTKEALVDALEKQKNLKEEQFQNDLEHKESQLSAITLQMLKKNELLDEIKSTIEAKEAISEQQVLKMVNKHFTQNSSWNDFDLYFESLNKNFYTRLKQRYPDISSNDLKICALIKLNLSIKEMASILNISPDSVKTARYRLRKKLQLVSEENLTDFILSI